MGLHGKAPHSRSIVGETQSAKGYIRRQSWTNPIVADADLLKNDQATSNSVITTVATFLTTIDFPRSITVTPGGTTADVPAGDVTITGKNIRDEVITEALTFAANATGAQETTKAFKTITSVVFPVQDGAGATYDIGVGDKLGLDRCMQGNEVLYATLAGVYETTRPTVTYDADEVEKNTVDLNGTLDGVKDIVVAYVSTELTDSGHTTA